MGGQSQAGEESRAALATSRHVPLGRSVLRVASHPVLIEGSRAWSHDDRRIWVPSAVLLVSFWAFTVLQGRPLTVSNAFVSISLFSSLQGTLRMLPAQITEWLRAMISVRRIERFLAEEDVPDWVCTLTRRPSTMNVGEVRLEEAVFAWPSVDVAAKSKRTSAPEEPNGHEEGPRFVLGPIDATLPRGKLTLVCGATGCGKTSFLTSILGGACHHVDDRSGLNVLAELDCISGRVSVDKNSVAYASQHAWLEPASIRANIVYETPFDAARYEAVLDACALRQDLSVLDHGDLTGAIA